MTDAKSGSNPLYLREDQLHEGMELLFFAYRDFTAECDAILAGYGFGRAHHRALYFIGRNPGIAVAELLAILRVTRQSLSRVLGRLMREKLVAARHDPEDGRRRLLTLTEAGSALERRLSAVQRARIARAYRAAGGGAVSGYREVLAELIDEAERHRFDRA